MSPEVTAIITTHVRPHDAREALASLRAETHRDVEIIVVDDGGALASSGIGIGHESLVVSSESRGVARARNLGLAAARGEFVIFLDDDDVALPHRIATLMAAARNREANVVFGLTRRVVVGSAVSLPPVPTQLRSSGPAGFEDVLACAPHINAVLARTEALRNAGGFDEQASHFDDWSAWLRMADRSSCVWHVHDVVAEWRLHANGLSAQLLTVRAMKSRLLALFDRLTSIVSTDHARALAAARRAVQENEVITYDDYVEAFAAHRGRPEAPRTRRARRPRDTSRSG